MIDHQLAYNGLIGTHRSERRERTYGDGEELKIFRLYLVIYEPLRKISGPIHRSSMGSDHDQMVRVPIRRSVAHRDGAADMGLPFLRGLQNPVPSVPDSHQGEPGGNHGVQRLYDARRMLQGDREECQRVALS